MSSHRRYSFGEYTLDLERGALLKGGADVKLRPKSFEVLRLLVQRHGQLVKKDELLNAVWGDVVVTDGAVGQCLIDVRRAIEDESQQVVRTVQRRGYIFDVPVTEADRGATGNGAQAHLPESPKPSPPAGQPRRALLVAAAAIAAALAAGATWWALGMPGRNAAASLTPGAASAMPNSIAVLPFVNMSPEPEQDYFSDGISEEILNLLAQTQGLQVIARTSSFSFRGSNANVAEIAANLNVTHVLEGSVRKNGDHVRITAQLIDAGNSSHLWSETYDRTLDDILAVQTDIASSVTEALKVQLLGAATAPLPPKSTVAYELYLRGQFFFGRRADGDMDRAAKYYREALEIDPDFARAWAGLAGATWIKLSSGELPRELGLSQLRDAATKAVALDPNLAEGHLRLANYHLSSHDPTTAQAHYQKAMALAPNNPLMLSTSAMVAADHGRLDEALEKYARVVALDPLSATQRHNFGHLLYSAGHLAEAQAQLLKAAEINPDEERGMPGFILILQGNLAAAETWFQESPPGPDRDQGMALVSHALGRTNEADAALARLIASSGRDDPFRIAEVLAYRGDADEAIEWLHAITARDMELMSGGERTYFEVRVSPFLKSLHADPRWKAWIAEREIRL